MLTAVARIQDTVLARGPFPQLAHNKRRFVRFPAMCRVEFTIEGRTTFVFTQDLSLGGMQLRNVKALSRGDTLTFFLYLSESGKPVGVEGLVQRIQGGSAGISFVANQEEATAAIHEFIGKRLISRAAERASASGGSAAQVADLAMYYCEIGRTDDAIDLYRKSLQRRSHEFVLYEQMATLLLHRIQQQGSAIDAWPLVAELETLVGRGLGVGKSRILESVSQEVEDLRKALTENYQNEKRQLKESLRKEIEAQGAQFKAELTRQAEAAIEKGVAARVKELEKEFQAKLAGTQVRAQIAERHKEATRQLAELERELKHHRSEIAREQTRFERERTKLEKQAQTLAAAQAKHAQAVSALASQEEAFALTRKEQEQQGKELKQRAKELALREEKMATIGHLGKLVEQLRQIEAELRQSREAR